MCPISGHEGGALATSAPDTDNILAARNRSHFDQHGLLAINLMCSTGTGTTALMDATIAALGRRHRIAIITNNHATAPDGPRVFWRGMAAVQVGMVSAGNLQAESVGRTLQSLPLAGFDVLFLENVGKLLESTNHYLGQHRNVTLLTSADGGDARLEHQTILRNTDLVMLSKSGLLEVMANTDPAQVGVALRMLGRRTPLVQTMAQQARSLAPWYQWIEKQLRSMRSVAPVGAPLISGAAWS